MKLFMKTGKENTTSKLNHVSGRRRFFNRIWVFLSGLACLELGWVTSSILKSQKGKKEKKREDIYSAAGKVENFSPGSITAIPNGQFYLACLEDGSFLALSRICTHLGCSLPWDAESKRFVCPCHGSTFDMSGEVLTPPATKALENYPLRIEDGIIQVNIARSIKRLPNGKPRSIKP